MMQYWQEQRELLRNTISDKTSTADAVHQLRHALLQTEQNALASINDDLLRQQAGVLMSCLKGSLHLLEAHSAGQVWVAQKSARLDNTVSPLLLCAAGAIILLILWCVLKGYWGAAILAGMGLVLGFAALLQERRKAAAAVPADEVKVSVGIHPERVLSVIDAQIHALDRYLDDFSYLNEQARAGGDGTDTVLLSRASELLEAIYDCDETERKPAEEAAHHLLGRLGLQVVEYSEETSRLFNALPSKSTTRTLSPAIVSTEDQRLLRRGTAAVQMNAAC